MRRLSSKLVLLVFFSTICTSYSQHRNGTGARSLPEIQQGEKCVKGRMYKMGCNTCHCLAQSRLVCTKMACIDPLAWRHMQMRKFGTTANSSCEAGKFYKKGCRKCFCTAHNLLKCSVKSDCQEINKTYTNPEHIRPLSTPEFYELPVLPHQGSECQPGVTYRIDCNTCFCLASGNLMCQMLLCPSYEDVYKLRTVEMSKKTCQVGDKVKEDCLECKCVSGKYACETNPVCKHTDGRRMLHGDFPSTHDKNYIDPEKMVGCAPGMVYKVHCNKCYCQDDRSLHCTQKSCLDYRQVQLLSKLKKQIAAEAKEN